ncbi:hypothetical protein GCM10011538_03220 [Ligilactobacillus murinus]
MRKTHRLATNLIPFTPLRHSKHILAWRKNVELSLAAQEFIEFVKNNKL